MTERNSPPQSVIWTPGEYVDATFPRENFRSVAVGPVTIRTPGSFTVLNTPEPGFSVVVRFGLVDSATRLGPREVSLSSSLIEGGVTAVAWRRVNVGSIWERGMRAILAYEFGVLAGEVEPDKYGMNILGFNDGAADIALMRARGPERKTLERVAQVYTMAEVAGLAPIKEIQQAFSTERDGPLPRPTAAKWAARARAEGLVVGADG